jgi:hypothetical protein
VSAAKRTAPGPWELEKPPPPTFCDGVSRGYTAQSGQSASLCRLSINFHGCLHCLIRPAGCCLGRGEGLQNVRFDSKCYPKCYPKHELMPQIQLASHFGRPYGQHWDSAGLKNPAPDEVLIASAFGLTLLTPVDAYRETDRAIKYGIMFIGLTFVACLLFEMATGTRPHVAQYGLIGLALCVVYLLLLSVAEQVGFALAYVASAAAVVAQATLYNWAASRRSRPCLRRHPRRPPRRTVRPAAVRGRRAADRLGAAVPSVAMWLTRNIHRPQPA